jgi:hypothetical protein
VSAERECVGRVAVEDRENAVDARKFLDME